MAGLRADEAKSINRSLTMLGMCINARANSAAGHAPYRDSKLTRLLKVRGLHPHPPTPSKLSVPVFSPALPVLLLALSLFCD